MNKMAKPYRLKGFTIINYLGDVWGDKIFTDAADAAVYLDKFWGHRDWRKDGKYFLAPASLIVTVTGKERVKL